jgi:hypothetical protein
MTLLIDLNYQFRSAWARCESPAASTFHCKSHGLSPRSGYQWIR